MSNNYLGLKSYTESDSYRFKGRQEEALQLYEQVIHNEYTICYAGSGEGKTSLLNAGLYPLLRGSLYFPINISFNQKDFENSNIDFDEIILKRIDEAFETYRKDTDNQVVYDMSSTDFSEYDEERKNTLLEKTKNKSWWKLRNYKPQIAGIDLIPVFVFDQFEEVFDRPKSALWTKKFFSWLETVSTDLCPNDIVSIVRAEIGEDAPFPKIKKSKDFKAIFSLRNEFIGDLDYWCMQKFFIPDLKNNRFCLKSLTINGAKEIMEQGEFDVQIVSDVIKNLAGNEYSDTELDIPCISALLLSIVCTSLSEKSETIKQDLEVLKGNNDTDFMMNHIITLFYLQSIENLQKKCVGEGGKCFYEKLDISQRHLRIIEQALINDNGKRLRISITSKELKKINFNENYLESFEKGRLIRISHFEGEDYVELIHDQLARVISERVKKRATHRIKSLYTALLFIFLAVMAGITLWTMGKDSPLVKHISPIVKLSQEEIDHSSNNYDTYSKEKCVEELHLKLAKHSIKSLRQLKRLYIENSQPSQTQITIQDCPMLDEIHVVDPITDLILNINDSICSINSIIYINPCLKKISVNQNRSILTFVVPKENKSFIWKDNTLWDSKGEIVYMDPNRIAKGWLDFPCEYKNTPRVYYNGNYYSNNNCFEVKDEYHFRRSKITSEEVKCHPAKKVIITDRVKYIEDEAFKYQDSLLEVEFDTNCQLDYLGDEAFAYCRKLKNVKLPRDLKDSFYWWWENPFLECNNISYEIPDSSNLDYDNGVVFRLGFVRGKDTINQPLFFSKKTQYSVSTYGNLFIPDNKPHGDSPYQFYKNGIVDKLPEKERNTIRVLLRTNLAEIDISEILNNDYEGHNGYKAHVSVYKFYNTKNIKTIHTGRPLPNYVIEFADSDKSDIILVVPKGSKSYYENDDNFKEFRRIEEENIPFWLPYYYSIKKECVKNWEQTKKDIGSNWKWMLPVLILVVLLYSVLIAFLIHFRSRRNGIEHLANIKIVLSIVAYILVGFITYTIFYWFIVYKYDLKNPMLWGNLIALPIAVTFSVGMLIFRTVTADDRLYIKAEWKLSWKKTKSSIKELPKHIRQHFIKRRRLYLCMILIGITTYGGYRGIYSIKVHKDLGKMIDAKDWERVSQIVYNKIMNSDSIDDIDRSWTRTMLLAANQDTISNGLDYSWYVPHSYSYYLYSDRNNKVYIVHKEGLGVQRLLDTLSPSSNPYFLGVFSDRYLLYNTIDSLHCYDLSNHSEIFDRFVGSIFNERRSPKEVMAWTNKHKLQGSTIFIFNANTGTLDSIPFPNGYNYLGSLSAGRYLEIGNDYISSGFYDLKAKTIIPKPNSVVGIYPQFINEKFGDTMVVSSTYKGELRKDTILDLAKHSSIIVGSNYLFYSNTLDNIQYIDFESGLKTEIGEGSIMFKNPYDNYPEDSLLIISKSDTITAFQLAEGKPVKLADRVIKNRIQYYGEGGKNLYNCMKKGIFANNINDTVRIYHLLYGKELKAFNTSFDFNSINENFIIKYEEKTKYIELYPLDGSSIKTPIIIKTQKALNKYEVSTIEDYIVKTNSEFFILPSLEQTINNNVYLNENQKTKLIKKLKSTCK